MEFRPLLPDDMAEMKALHVECFPISYEDDFYWNSVYGRGIVSFAAVDRNAAAPPLASLASSGAPQPPPEQQWRAVGVQEQIYAAAAGPGRPGTPPPVGVPQARRGRLAGVATLSIDRGLLGFSPLERCLGYILTLGVTQDYRRRGVARALLGRLVAHCESIASCRAVYLHTAAENEAAARFYEQNGFQAVRRLERFYTIDGRPCDALLFLRYVNGGRPSCALSDVGEWVAEGARGVARALRWLGTWLVHGAEEEAEAPGRPELRKADAGQAAAQGRLVYPVV
eukprot:tig00001278_g7991.t1